MLVGEIIELALIKASGGVLSPDIALLRMDAMGYFPAAVNYAIRQQYYIETSDRGVQIRKNYLDLPSDFIATYEDVPVEKNTNRDVRYSELPKTIVSLPHNLGIETVSDMHGQNEFIMMSGQFSLSGYDAYTNKTTFYWLEGNKIFYKNISPAVNKVLVRLMATSDGLSMDDKAPIPGGMEKDVIDMLSEFLTGQRKLSGETIVDQKDDLAK